ncbi:MAG: hypothetical protein ACOCVC_02535 [Spirochaeta sp.]
MKSKYFQVQAALVFIGMVLVFASCGQDQARGIFATIEETRELDLDHAMPDNAKILSLNEYKEGDDHYLFAAVGNQLLFRPFNDEDNWEEMPLPARASFALDSAVSGSAGNYFITGIFTDSSGTSFVRYAALPEAVGSDFNRDSWESPDSGITGNPYAVFRSGTSAFVSSRITSGDDPGNYLRQVASNGNVTPVSFETGSILPEEISTLVQAYDYNGTVYLLSQTDLYTAATGDTDFTRNATLDSSGSGGFTDIIVTDDGIYITTDKGFIRYSGDDGSRWDDSSAYTRSDSEVPLLSILQITPENGDKTILAGTEGYGFAVFDGEKLSRPTGSTQDYYHLNFGGSELSTTTITTLFMPDGILSGKEAVYAGSAGKGLWRAIIENTDFVWGRE